MIPLDTDKSAYEAQIAAYRRMSGSERLNIAFKLSLDVRALAAAGIRKRRPELTERQVAQELFRQIYGDELFLQVYPPQKRV